MTIEGIEGARARQPFVRQEGETSRAFAAFGIYYSMAPRKRSLKAAAEIFYQRNGSPNLSQLKKWSRTYRWVSRAEAYDDFLDEKRREKTLEMILAAVKAPDVY